MTERMQGGIHVRELDTTAGAMFEVICALHGAEPATFDEEQAIRWASIHAARLHGTRMVDLEVHHLSAKPGAA